MRKRSARVYVRDRIAITYASSQLPAATKERIIDATKAILDIANESADAFPPLKSCLGGINALIKHYEVRFHRIASRSLLIHSSQESKDVEEKLGDLIPWLTKLKDNVMAPSAEDNREEMERLEQLTRFPLHHYLLIHWS